MKVTACGAPACLRLRAHTGVQPARVEAWVSTRVGLLPECVWGGEQGVTGVLPLGVADVTSVLIVMGPTPPLAEWGSCLGPHQQRADHGTETDTPKGTGTDKLRRASMAPSGQRDRNSPYDTKDVICYFKVHMSAAHSRRRGS